MFTFGLRSEGVGTVLVEGYEVSFKNTEVYTVEVEEVERQVTVIDDIFEAQQGLQEIEVTMDSDNVEVEVLCPDV